MARININRAAWESARAAHGIRSLAQRMGMPRWRLHLVLTEVHAPSTRFVAAALLSLPATFGDLFTVSPSRA